MDRGKTLADFLADRSEGAVKTGVQLIAASLVLTVEDLIHHGEYPFLVSCFSKCDRQMGGVVRRRTESLFDQLQPVLGIEACPGTISVARAS
jgi:hypothetical protein